MLLHLQQVYATEQGEPRAPHSTLPSGSFPRKDPDAHQERAHHCGSREYPLLVAHYPGFPPGNKESDNTLGSVKGVTPAPLPRILIHNLFGPL